MHSNLTMYHTVHTVSGTKCTILTLYKFRKLKAAVCYKCLFALPAIEPNIATKHNNTGNNYVFIPNCFWVFQMYFFYVLSSTNEIPSRSLSSIYLKARAHKTKSICMARFHQGLSKKVNRPFKWIVRPTWGLFVYSIDKYQNALESSYF